MNVADEKDLRATIKDHLTRCMKDGDIKYHENKIIEKIRAIENRKG